MAKDAEGRNKRLGWVSGSAHVNGSQPPMGGPTPQDYEDVRAEQRHHDALLRRRNNQLRRAPDCRDPEHPGCELCADDDDEEDV